MEAGGNLGMASAYFNRLGSGGQGEKDYKAEHAHHRIGGDTS